MSVARYWQQPQEDIKGRYIVPTLIKMGRNIAFGILLKASLNVSREIVNSTYRWTFQGLSMILETYQILKSFLVRNKRDVKIL